MRENPLWGLLLVFVPFSLVSIGGGSSILAGIQHQSVDVHAWVSEPEFVRLFAISRAAPGPGSLLVTLIGWTAAGWIGAIVATLALFVPSSILTYAVAHFWNRYRGTRWHAAIERGLAPVAAGLILSGVLAVLQLADGGVKAWLFAVGTALFMLWRPKLSPLVLLAGGGAIYTAWGLLTA